MNDATPTPTIEVPDGADIKDIRGPVAIASFPWLPVLLGVLVGAALLAWLVRFLRNRTPEAPPPRPAHELALERLDAARRLMTPAQVKDFSSEVTGAVRGYVEARFGVAASRQTTDEFLRTLLDRDVPDLRAHQSLLSEFLTTSDLVKFARGTLTQDEMEEMHASASRFVQTTHQSGERTG